MKIIELPIETLVEASWNANRMDQVMLTRLRQSIGRFNIVENLVVRQVGPSIYEVLSGNQLLRVLKEMGLSQVPCVIVELDDAGARLLAQALNHIRGQDDLGLRAELLSRVLETIPEAEVLSVLPETGESLKAIYFYRTGDHGRLPAKLAAGPGGQTEAPAIPTNTGTA